MQPEKKNDVLYRLDYKYSRKFKMEYRKTSQLRIVNQYISILSDDICKFVEDDDSTLLLFEKYGIESPFMRSKVLMHCWHDKLNSREVGLETYLKRTISYYERFETISIENERISKYNFRRFSVGDSVSVIFSVKEYEDSSRQIMMYSDPYYEWIYKPEKDLRIDGIIIDKKINQVDEYLFYLKIFKLNRLVKYLMFHYDEGDTLKLSVKISPSTILPYTKDDIDSLAPILFERGDSIY